MITSQELGWIAGLLEGEGCFHSSASGLLIIIKMTDLDVIERFRALTKTTNRKITVIPHEKFKTRYSTAIYGSLAIQWMMTLYPLMGIRRKEKIKDIIEKWKIGFYKEEIRVKAASYRENNPESYEKYQKKYKENKVKRDAIKAVAIQKGISKEEAEKILDGFLNDTIQ